MGAVCAIALATLLSACGSDEDQGTIPQDQGNAVLEQLETVQQQLEMGDCDGAEATAQEIRDSIESISQDVPADLEEALVQASDNLTSQTRTQCEVPEPEPVEPPTGASGEDGSSEEGSEEDDG